MIVFKTPGVLPIDACTTFGINHKPNSTNPFGYFGTGLKYAIAVILRLGGKITLVSNEIEYEFYVSPKEFRGKEFGQVRMKKRKGLLSKWQYDNLPFTTELGKNWHPWMAFRELESNTRDEGGTTFKADEGYSVEAMKGAGTLRRFSYLLVECPQIEAELDGDTFLNYHLGEDAPVPVHNGANLTSKLTIYEKPSKYIYYRGVRVHEMQNPARLTYDLSDGAVELSEDRSIRNVYAVFRRIAGVIQTQIADEELLEAILTPDSDESRHFETDDLDYDAYEYSTSSVFKSLARRLGLRGFKNNITSFYGSYTSYHAPRVAKSGVTLPDETWQKIITALIFAEEPELAKEIADEAYENGHYEMELERWQQEQDEKAEAEAIAGEQATNAVATDEIFETEVPPNPAEIDVV